MNPRRLSSSPDVTNRLSAVQLSLDAVAATDIVGCVLACERDVATQTAAIQVAP